MGTRTSQLQIRVTEEEKAALKHLAKAANLSVSGYVLAQALPSRHGRLSRALEALTRVGVADSASLDALQSLILDAPATELGEALAGLPLEGSSPILANQLAAMVEHASAASGVDPPQWASAIPPLARPHFGWSLSSLQPHQIRVAPVPFKRRGIFFDPATRPAMARGAPHSPGSGPRATPVRLAALAELLSISELKVEFYFVGGAILSQAFHARPPTAHISALFRAAGEVDEAVGTLGVREGWGSSWLTDAVKELLQGGHRPERYLEAPNLSVFMPPPEYVLAIKVAALRMGDEPGVRDDLRYLLRGLNLGATENAMEIAERYFRARHLPPNAPAVLSELLAARGAGA